ncbi:MAG: Flp family type IVb pilin [Pseudomonadota bacterium]|nr:Flp family type IVb pilin [Pseudomonadota bacterium]
MATPKNRRTLRADQRGATAIEYGLICACIIIAMVAGLASLGGGTMGMWTKVNSELQNH